MTGYRIGVAAWIGEVTAVLLDSRDTVVATVDRPGNTGLPTAVAIGSALEALLARSRRHGIGACDVDQIMVVVADEDVLTETLTEFDRQDWPVGLGKVAVVRLGAATTAVPPLALWPQVLRARVSAGEACLTGGVMLDGAEFEPLDTERLAAFARGVAGRVSAAAITAVFSSVTPEHELAAAAVLRKELGPAVPILLSHEFGGLGLLERENTTVLQSALTAPAVEGATGLLDAVTEQGLGEAEIFLARGDGTIATLDYAATHPLLLRGSIDAATARGVARLARQEEALVAFTDVVGHPRAVCAVTAGAPRVASGRVEVAGVPIGLRSLATVPVGPTYELIDLYRALDRAKGQPGDLPLLLTGPGACGFARTLPSSVPGTVRVTVAPGVDTAAAIGAATAPVSGEARRIIPLGDRNADAIRQRVRDSACAAAMRAGAEPGAVTVAEVDETPVAYLSEPAVVLWVRAEGPPRTGWPAGRQGARRVAEPCRAGACHEGDDGSSTVDRNRRL